MPKSAELLEVITKKCCYKKLQGSEGMSAANELSNFFESLSLLSFNRWLYVDNNDNCSTSVPTSHFVLTVQFAQQKCKYSVCSCCDFQHFVTLIQYFACD